MVRDVPMSTWYGRDTGSGTTHLAFKLHTKVNLTSLPTKSCRCLWSSQHCNTLGVQVALSTRIVVTAVLLVLERDRWCLFHRSGMKPLLTSLRLEGTPSKCVGNWKEKTSPYILFYSTPTKGRWENAQRINLFAKSPLWEYTVEQLVKITSDEGSMSTRATFMAFWSLSFLSNSLAFWDGGSIFEWWVAQQPSFS